MNKDDIQASGQHWYIRNEQAPSKTVLVFIHGIWSSNAGCWTEAKTGAFWPKIAGGDVKLGAPDVYLAGYPTSLLSGEYTAKDAAESLAATLSNDGVFEYDRLVFVCHSQGGIVARFLLLDKETTFERRKVGLLLCASPAWGSRLGYRLRHLTKLLGFQQGQRLAFGDASLQELDREFHKLMSKRPAWLTGKSLLETKMLWLKIIPVGKIVHPDSASRYFEWVRIHRADHSTIVKPLNERHESHQMLVNFCRDNRLTTSHLVKGGLLNLADAMEGVAKVCAPTASTSRDECLESLTNLKRRAAEAIDVLDRTDLELERIMHLLAVADEMDPLPPGTSKKQWPFRVDMTPELSPIELMRHASEMRTRFNRR